MAALRYIGPSLLRAFTDKIGRCLGYLHAKADTDRNIP